MIKKAIALLIAVLIFISGFAIAKLVFDRKAEQSQQEQATVLLEKVQQVMKLVTVEGNFSEVYDSKSTKDVTVFLPLPSTFSFPKSATLHVQGKVLVGYDMEGIKISVDSLSRTITLSNIPTQAEILAVDHELRYKNLDESFFNKFKAADYTIINQRAKEILRQKAADSRLMQEAELQGNQVLEVVTTLAAAAGYTVVQSDAPARSFKN